MAKGAVGDCGRVSRRGLCSTWGASKPHNNMVNSYLGDELSFGNDGGGARVVHGVEINSLSFKVTSVLKHYESTVKLGLWGRQLLVMKTGRFQRSFIWNMGRAIAQLYINPHDSAWQLESRSRVIRVRALDLDFLELWLKKGIPQRKAHGEGRKK